MQKLHPKGLVQSHAPAHRLKLLGIGEIAEHKTCRIAWNHPHQRKYGDSNDQERRDGAQETQNDEAGHAEPLPVSS